MLELDEKTGLRDYDVTYTYTQGSSADDVREDPYFGKKIAGGHHVSGEASYIKYIDGYYYLYVTYGGLNANAGYQMRVFRSANPDGPYSDPYHSGAVAIYDEARVNYGPDGLVSTMVLTELAIPTVVRISLGPMAIGGIWLLATILSVLRGTTLS